MDKLLNSQSHLSQDYLTLPSQLPLSFSISVPVSLRLDLPSKPGIYVYLDQKNTILYIGKAINLKNRVNNYFHASGDGRQKLTQLVPQINTIGCIFVTSEFEALLLEATLIRKFLPKYNTLSRDDKHPIYIVITKETFPRIKTLRKNQLNPDKHHIYGPFQSTRIIKQLLTQIRKIIPYCTTTTDKGTSCFYTNLGLCNPCPRHINKIDNLPIKSKLTSTYKHNLNLIKRLLDGKSKTVASELQKMMRSEANSQNFENAAKLRDSIQTLNQMLTQPLDSQNFINNPHLAHEIKMLGLAELNEVLSPLHQVNLPTELSRIEAYDISTYGGKHTTGSQVVLIDGEPANSEYRKYRISSANQHADLPAMSEMLKRRFNHPEWQFPHLVIIDGGKTQLDAVKLAIKNLFWQIPFIGLAKKFETIIIPQTDGSYRELNLSRHSHALRLIQLIRDEAHRFAGKYQRHLHSKSLLASN